MNQLLFFFFIQKSESAVAAASRKSNTPPVEVSDQVQSKDGIGIGDEHSSKGNADQVAQSFGEMSIHSTVAVC